MFFIGIITDKNSENNIKNIMHNKLKPDSQIIFLNKDNLSNFKNVTFDSIVVNDDIDEEYSLNKILEKSKYILWNSDIHYKSDKIKNMRSNIITYGYNSKATVTISSATDDNYMIYVQENIGDKNDTEGIQEIKFEKYRNNINAYDGMIVTIMNLIYNKNNE